MNYYIQGCAANAEEIKAAFEKLGIDVLDFGFADKTVVYCSIGGACVQSLPYGINLMHILHSHPGYKELELPVEPKFKVHDWVVDGDRVAIIYDLQKNGYVGHDINRKDFVCRYSDEGRLHLWTIADAKDGDILHHSCTASNGTFIFKGVDESGKIFCYCDYDSEDYFCLGENHHIPCYTDSKFLHPATKEQRELLFKKMKEAGYQWDADKKELRKIQPHYDIAYFQPKQWVLVRDDDEWEWALTRFSYLSNGSTSSFVCINGASFQQCIPFEGNEELLGTTDMCDEQYINW